MDVELNEDVIKVFQEFKSFLKEWNNDEWTQGDMVDELQDWHDRLYPED